MCQKPPDTNLGRTHGLDRAWTGNLDPRSSLVVAKYGVRTRIRRVGSGYAVDGVLLCVYVDTSRCDNVWVSI